MRILDRSDVEALLTPELALTAMRDLFELDPDSGGFGRLDLRHPTGWLRVLPGYLSPLGVFGYKTIHRTEGVGMRYAVAVHDLATGELTGLVDGLALTNLRTGAVSAVAAEHLAKPEVEVAALIGTGPVARGQLELLHLVRPAAEVRVFARTLENRRRFIAECDNDFATRLVEAASLEDAVHGAQLVTLATKASEPVLTRAHLHAGVHVNSVGPASRDQVEVDPSIFGDFDRVVCDSVALVFAEAGDAHRAAAGGYDPGRASDLADVVAGRAGRRSSGEKTLFKSVGNGLQDLIVAARLIDAAAGAGIGRIVDDFVSVKPS